MAGARTASPHRQLPLVMAIVLGLAAFAIAQPAPNITLVGPDRPEPGDTVQLTAAGLRSSADHTVRVEAPDGHESVQTVTVREGRVEAEVVLGGPGRHLIWLEGPGLEARFAVTAFEPSPTGATPSAPMPAPADPEAPAPSIAAPPSTEAPEGATNEGATPEEATPDEATPNEATPNEATPDRALAVVLTDNEVAGTGGDGEVLWRFSFPPSSGTTGIALLHLDRVWVAHGHQVLALDPANGRVVDRVATSGQVVALQPVGTGLNVISELTAPGAELRVEARLAGGVLTPPAIFDPSGPHFDALQREAEVGDPAARLSVDPTNPFLYLQAAIAAPTETERLAATTSAIAAGRTFFDLARLARAFADQRWWAAANEAMAAAVIDFEGRGYDPALLTSVDLHDRYGFPLRPLQRALMRNDADAADLWARWLFALSGPDLPGAGTELRAYATALGDRGDRVGSATWRERAGQRTNPSVSEVFARNALLLGRGGTVASLGLSLAFLMLHLTLMAKYARAQRLAQRQAREAGRRVPAWPAFRALRFFGWTEKSVLLMMLAGAYATVTLFGWVQRGDAAVAATSAGHLDAPLSSAVWSDGRGDAAARLWVEAYRADRSGDPAARADALALVAELGAGVEPVRAALEAGSAVPTPSPVTLRAAAAGTWTTAVADAFRRPLAMLDDQLLLFGLPAWSWPVQLALFWLVVAWHVAALFVPRPRYARDAPRPFGYHLMALVVPGTGQADELYGVLLLVPWAIFGIDAVVQLFGGSSPLGIPFRAGLVVLSVLFVVNAVAWAIEFVSVRKRLQKLRVERPDLARAFGLVREAAPEASSAE